METSGEALSIRKIVVMIAVVCIVGVFILDRPPHGNRSVRSFIRQRTGQVSTDINNGLQLPMHSQHFSSVVGIESTELEASSRTSVCTGVLISKRDVLTAGHCCYLKYRFRVHTGVALNQRTYSVDIANVWIMPGYNYDDRLDRNNKHIYTPEKDLCMMKLDREVDFTPEKIIISKPIWGENVEIVGFGLIGRGRASGGRLHYARTTVTTCENALNWAKNKKNVIKDIVCAGHVSGGWPFRRAAHACTGDSGGPLLSPKLPGENARKLFGILSDGNKPCEEGENSYTNITKQEFQDFINAHANDIPNWMPICHRP